MQSEAVWTAFCHNVGRTCDPNET